MRFYRFLARELRYVILRYLEYQVFANARRTYSQYSQQDVTNGYATR